jgi:hypothetical protein
MKIWSRSGRRLASLGHDDMGTMTKPTLIYVTVHVGFKGRHARDSMPGGRIGGMQG